MIEAVGKVADTLRHNPLCLSLLILVLVQAVLWYYRETALADDRAELVTTLLQRCAPDTNKD